MCYIVRREKIKSLKRMRKLPGRARTGKKAGKARITIKEKEINGLKRTENKARNKNVANM